MNNKRTRFASAVLALAMLLGTLPVAAAAEEGVQVPETVTEPVAVSESAVPAQGTITIKDKDGMYTSLTEAINQASAGDTIVLGAGIYEIGNLNIAKQINLVGAGKEATILQGSIFWGQSTGNVTVSDLKMEGQGTHVALNMQGSFSANGQYLNQATITIEDCKFENYQYTIGVNSYVTNSKLVLNNCEFVSTGCAAAIQTGAGNTVEAAETTISGGYAVQSFGGSGDQFYNNFYKTFTTEGTADLDATETPITFVNATGTDLENGAKLQAAVDAAADNAVIYVTAGDYDVTYGDGMGGQFHHNLMISNDNLTIVGEDGATLCAHYISMNGNVQQTVLIAGDNVTLDNLTVEEIDGYPNKTVEIRGAANATVKNCTIYSTSSAVYVGEPTSTNYTITGNEIVGGGICIGNGAGGQGETDGAGSITCNTISGPILFNGLGAYGASGYNWMKYDLKYLPTISGNEFIAAETLSGMEYYLRSLSYLETGNETDGTVYGMGPMTMISEEYVNSFVANNEFEGNKDYTYMMYPGNENFAYYGTTAVTDEAKLQSFVANVEPGTVINLAADITLTEKLTINKDVTIDGKEHTIKGQNDDASVHIEITGGNVTIQNATLTEFGGATGTVNGTAVIKVPSDANSTTNVVASGLYMSMFNRAAFAFDAGTFAVSNCEIDCANSSPAAYKLSKGVYAGYSAEGAVTGTTITNSASDYAEWTAAGIEVWDSAKVTVSGCTLTNMTDGIYLFAATGYGSPANSTGKVILSNNTVNVTDYAVTASYGYGDKNHDLSVAIRSGNYTGAVRVYAVDLNSYDEDLHPYYDEYPADADIADITITGGTFSVNPSDYVASGYAVSQSNGTYTVYKMPTDSTPAGTITDTTTNPDGSTTTTVTKPDGSTTETTTAPNGSSSVVNTSKDGQVTATVTVSSAAVSEAEDAVALPMPEVPVTTDRDEAPVVTVNLPANTTAKVEIPVEDVTAGTVAILVHTDGTEEVVKTSVTTENGVVLTVENGAKVKIVDNAIDFVDVKDSYWGADAIDFATSRELFTGTSATKFSPENTMTRAMIVTVLARYEGVDTTGGDNWYDQGVEWAMENGISDGTNLTGSVTREQLVTMLYRYVGEPEVSGTITGFADSDSVSSWASDAMTWAVQNGIISGSNGMLDAQGTATRAQVATILMRFVALEF